MAREIELKMDIQSYNQLFKALDELEDKTARKDLAVGCRKAMKPIIRTAKANAPKDTGLLRKSIGWKQKRYGRTGTIYTVVGPRTGFERLVERTTLTGQKRMVTANPVNYAHLVELGTAPHSIRIPRDGKMVVWHPGITRPRAFLRQAYDQHKHKVPEDVAVLVWGEITKTVDRVKVKGTAARYAER